MVERTCIVCYSRLPKKELTRYVWRENGVIVDTEQVMKGRGCYSCKKPNCIEQLFKSEKRLRRAFRLTK